MHARSTRAKRPLRAVKTGARRPMPPRIPDAKPSEIVELIYQLMIERGGIPRRGSQERDSSEEEVRMAEAP